VRASRRGSVEVELVEAEAGLGADPASVPGAGPGPDPDAPGPLVAWLRPRLHRVPRRAWAGLVAAGAVVAVVLAGVDVRADRAQEQRLARTDGLTVPLDRPLDEAWRVPAVGVLGQVGDLIVARTGDGGYLGVAVADGAVRWRYDGSPSTSCQLGTDGAPSGLSSLVAFPALDSADSSVLMCTDRGESVFGQVPATPVDVLDPATGEVLRRLTFDGSMSTMLVGEDVVVLGVDPSGTGEREDAAPARFLASRWSLRTGEQVWSFRGEPVVLVPADGMSMSVDDEVVEASGDVWTVTLDVATGAERAPRADDAPGLRREVERVVLADGATAETAVDDDGIELTVVEPDGTTRFAREGYLLAPAVDDGTVPGTLVAASVASAQDGRDVVGLDARTGEELWTARSGWGTSLRVAGLLVARDSSGTTAIDARTGAVRWSDDEPAGVGGLPQVLTDGHVVLTSTRVDKVPSLVARDLGSGRQRWVLPSPVGTVATFARLPGGEVLVVGPMGLVALHP
jgi:outer membrane protein assembly factor BamB